MEPHVALESASTGALAGRWARCGVGGVRREPALARGARASSWRRRPIALVVVALYRAVALLDSFAWVGGERGRDAAPSRARCIDRSFPRDFQERSYSAPLATRRASTAARRSRIPAAICSAPTSWAATCSTDAQGRARGAADRRAHEPDRHPAGAAVRRQRRATSAAASTTRCSSSCRRSRRCRGSCC